MCLFAVAYAMLGYWMVGLKPTGLDRALLCLMKCWLLRDAFFRFILCMALMANSMHSIGLLLCAHFQLCASL